MDDFEKFVIAPRDFAATHCRAASVIENQCEKLIHDEPENNNEHAAMYISSAILRVFSIELALKSLGFAERSEWKMHEHRLKPLFQLLSAESQNEIKGKALIELIRPFDEVLLEISTVFVDWRYAHEKLGTGAELDFDTDELRIIAHSVLDVLQERIQSTT